MEKWVSVVVDARNTTQLQLLSPEIIKVTAGPYYPKLVLVKLVGPNNSPIPNKAITFYRNDVWHSQITTNASGIAAFDYYTESEGVRYFRAIFEQQGSDYYYLDQFYKSSNEVKYVIIVEGSIPLTPVSVLFDVQPGEFTAGTRLNLMARVLNTSSGCPVEDFVVRFYRVMADGSKTFLDYRYTNASGWATLQDTYSLSLGVYTYLVNVTGSRFTGGSRANVTIVSPVTLKVANFTKMYLGFGKINGSNHDYFVSGLLLSVLGVPNKPVKFYINDTLAGIATTYGMLGKFNITLNLAPADNKPTLYNVRAVFEGDNPQNVTSYLYTPNGTCYPLCTTIHHGYGPAINYAAVAVKPQSTQITAASNITSTENGLDIQPPKTTEEAEQEAKASGRLTIWHEFSWWYPWYKLHVDAHVNPSLSYWIDLFGSGYLNFEGPLNKTNVNMEIAGYGAVTEASLMTAISAGIALFPEKLTALLVGGASLCIGTIVAICAAHVYTGEDFHSCLWGMLPILSIALYMTFAFVHPIVWLKSVVDLWATFSELLLVSVAVTSLTVCFSLAMALIWPAPIRGMLSIPIILSIITIWISMGF